MNKDSLYLKFPYYNHFQIIIFHPVVQWSSLALGFIHKNL